MLDMYADDKLMENAMMNNEDYKSKYFELEEEIEVAEKFERYDTDN